MGGCGSFASDDGTDGGAGRRACVYRLRSYPQAHTLPYYANLLTNTTTTLVMFLYLSHVLLLVLLRVMIAPSWFFFTILNPMRIRLTSLFSGALQAELQATGRLHLTGGRRASQVSEQAPVPAKHFSGANAPRQGQHCHGSTWPPLSPQR